MNILEWQQRPTEIANLLNPAFCSLILRESISSFTKEKSGGMPYPLAFLILPIVLHKSTRLEIPKKTVTKMHVWIQEKSQVRIQFAERASRLAPYTRESLLFGVRNSIIDIDKYGNLVGVGKKPGDKIWPPESEPLDCKKKAEFLGRWLAKSGETATIFAMWGIKP